MRSPHGAPRHGRRTAAAIGRAARAVFPLSPRGLLLLTLSGLILGAGVIRTDLAALFWGASFLLFTVYALAAGHLFRLSLRHRYTTAPDWLTVVLSSSGVSAGEDAGAHVTARLPRVFAPGFAVRLTLPLAWHDRRIDSVAHRLAPGGNQTSMRFRAEHRGVYTSREAVLEMRDILGFTVHRLVVPLRESLTVFPSLHASEELARFMEQADESSVYARRRRRSEEHLEARKYYPGDDVRRLNWKVFAHLNELFLRVGEEVPPPESRILFVLDCTANPLVPHALAADYLDGLVDSCASLLVSLLEKRIEVMLSLPGVRECRSYAVESRAALLAALADAWWTDAAWAPDLPGRKSLHVAVFSSPGSPGLRHILSSVKRRGWGASLFIKGVGRQPDAGKRRLRDVLFIRAAGPRRDLPATIGGRERSALADALSRDLAAYRGPAGMVKHAAEI